MDPPSEFSPSEPTHDPLLPSQPWQSILMGLQGQGRQEPGAAALGLSAQERQERGAWGLSAHNLIQLKSLTGAGTAQDLG